MSPRRVREPVASPVARRAHRRRRAVARWLGVLVLVAGSVTVVATLTSEAGDSASGDIAVAGPPRAGWFRTLPAGSWHRLPSEATCARRVHRSRWEPRPSNYDANHTMPDRSKVHASLRARPRTEVDHRWNRLMLARVTGHYVGTTDEIIQWAACKWGVSDNILRAMAATESSWFQYLTDPVSGACVEQRGCGDVVGPVNAASRTFCAGVNAFGHDYAHDYAPGRCPKTFSIAGVMSYQDPGWGRMPGNQNGTFPFNRDSTAFALDYLGGYLRGCTEGWESWLKLTGTMQYQPGRIWGCVGAWYAGSWEVPDAVTYRRTVRDNLDHHIWLRKSWGDEAQFGVK